MAVVHLSTVTPEFMYHIYNELGQPKCKAKTRPSGAHDFTFSLQLRAFAAEKQ